MCNLDAETPVGFAAEVRPEGPPTDQKARSLLLRLLLEMQLLWAQAAYMFCWKETHGDEAPSASVNLAAMGAWTAKLLARYPHDPTGTKVCNAHMPSCP